MQQNRCSSLSQGLNRQQRGKAVPLFMWVRAERKGICVPSCWSKMGRVEKETGVMALLWREDYFLGGGLLSANFSTPSGFRASGTGNQAGRECWGGRCTQPLTRRTHYSPIPFCLWLDVTGCFSFYCLTPFPHVRPQRVGASSVWG